MILWAKWERQRVRGRRAEKRMHESIWPCLLCENEVMCYSLYTSPFVAFRRAAVVKVPTVYTCCLSCCECSKWERTTLACGAKLWRTSKWVQWLIYNKFCVRFYLYDFVHLEQMYNYNGNRTKFTTTSTAVSGATSIKVSKKMFTLWSVQINKNDLCKGQWRKGPLIPSFDSVCLSVVCLLNVPAC